MTTNTPLAVKDVYRWLPKDTTKNIRNYLHEIQGTIRVHLILQCTWYHRLENFRGKKFFDNHLLQQKLNRRNIFFANKWGKFTMSGGHSNENKTRRKFSCKIYYQQKIPIIRYVHILYFILHRLLLNLNYLKLWSNESTCNYLITCKTTYRKSTVYTVGRKFGGLIFGKLAL